MKTAIVAAVHIQPSSKWIQALIDVVKADEADVILVDDSDGKLDLPFLFNTYDYKRQQEELGDELYKQFEQFHHSSACKNFGTWLAYKKGYEYIIVIDSDCIVPKDFVQSHINYLNSKGDGWDNPIEGTEMYSRGFPYSKRLQEKWAHMGLWENELDLYGTDRIGRVNLPKKPATDVSESNGAFFPLSGMNVSFKREAIPYMLFLPNFSFGDFHFSRHDDIWGGYIFQKIAHAKEKALSFGEPFVFHDTVVVPEEDAEEEVAMIAYEDSFYDMVDCLIESGLKTASQQDIFELLSIIADSEDTFVGLKPAFDFWSKAFNEI